MIRILIVALLLLPCLAQAQWTNRYPLAEGFDHHVYLEGFDLPILNAGPMDPAPSPSGKEVAFSLRGWLWLLDVESGNAHRITSAAGVDARPEWSPSGETLVFIRDSGSQLHIVALDIKSGKERVLVDVDAMNLDPVFSPDEKYVYYASAENGPIEIWRVALDSLERQRITAPEKGAPRPIKRRPQIIDQESLLLYLKKRGSSDSIELLNTRTGTSSTLIEDRITAQADMSLSPDGKYLAYVWPFDGGWELRKLAVAAPATSVLLTQSLGMPLAPAFSQDGAWIWFAEANDEQRTELKRISADGGAVESIEVKKLDWGTPTGTLIVRTEVDGVAAPARLHAVDAAGHPVIPASGAVQSEGQNGRVFFYSGGQVELLAPAGKVTIYAVQGFETPELVQAATVRPNTSTSVTLDLKRIWDADEHGWYSADNHFHLNYGGPYRLKPEDILPNLRGEVLDIVFPLLANLHNRFLQQELWGWRTSERPIIEFGQEVRAHFLGHVMLMGIEDLFWPWVWGPGYQVYGEDDRPNSVALRHARDQGGLGGYVHPVPIKDPFTEETAASIPIAFVADAVLGEVDIIELVCLWTDEIGTAALWHKVLNLGIPLAASAGSDIMSNYYRTMAIGSTRVYVKPDGELTTASYLQALKAGRSFVSNGPMLEFTVAGAEPGQVVKDSRGSADWSLNVHSALPFDSVEIFVNGTVVQALEGNPEAGSKTYQGSIDIPAGGWITARVLGTNTGWPAMDSYLYAETSPVWFGQIGSTDPAALRQSAQDLLMVLEVAEKNLRAGYGNTPIPNLLAHFEQARARLRTLAGE